MNRIDACFEQCRNENRLAFIPYITAGDPSLEVTERLVCTLVENGADIIEMGIPFSDPMADGPTIQQACERALRADLRMDDILDMVTRLRERNIQTPIVLFSYFNLIFKRGVDVLAQQCARAGLDAWLTVDVPVEGVGEIEPALRHAGLHWIALVAPTTPEDRLDRIIQHAGGFIYYITVTGVTGTRTSLPDDVREHLDSIRKKTRLPVAAGFGISSPGMIRQLAPHADAVVVGSKLINTLHAAPDHDTGLHDVAQITRDMVAACRNERNTPEAGSDLKF